jgi:PhnB protein
MNTSLPDPETTSVAKPDAQTLLQPYLFFGGRCEEAVAFYREALGAELVMMMRHRESPEPPPPGMIPEGWGEKVMHAAFKIGGNLVMASDGCGQAPQFAGFTLSLSLPEEGAVRQAFAALAEGGEVTMPLEKTFWSPLFGMVTDRFGVGWMVTITTEHHTS